MADRKKVKDDPEQSKRFLETARKLKADKSEQSFDQAIQRISVSKEKAKTP